MSFIIKGFCTINTMLDGVIGNVAPLGELSDYSRTFSTQKTTIASRTYESVSVEVFSCKEDGIIKSMPTNTDTFLLATLEEITQTFVNNIPFEEQFTSKFPTSTLVSVGATIEHDGALLPGMIKFTTVIDSEPCTFVIWFSDAAFRTGYDEHEIRVLPPIPNPLDLESTLAEMLAILEDYDYSEKMEAIEVLKDQDPTTKIATLKLKWTDPVSDTSIDLVWTLITFGQQGLIYENQIQAIRDYLLATTGKVPDDWTNWIPDLVTAAVITIIPLWDNVALESTGSIEYVHSPLATITDINEALVRRYGRAATTEETSKAIYGVCLYKATGFVAFPEPNSGEDTLFIELYPDYTLININDINLNRLSVGTRSAITAIERGIRLAEIDNGSITLPLDVQRYRQANRDYLSYVVDGITHLIMTKASYNA